jgi:hypothetical protein
VRVREDYARIVAEVSTTWIAGESKAGVLATRFEQVIAVNEDRGYTLESWQFRQTVIYLEIDGRPQLVETIIAVFSKVFAS